MGTLSERFAAKVAYAGKDDCWMWTGCAPGGRYGQIQVEGRRRASAHRLAWQFVHGPIPLGMEVCHTCDNPKCVNPAHLWLGTRQENDRDKIAKGRSHEQKKTHCPRGHAYDAVNTYVNRGWRRCRECKKLLRRAL